MFIFGLSGWKGSGKDMIAGYLVSHYGFQRISFADPLKDFVANKYSLNRASLDDQKLKESPILSMPVDPKDDFSRTICNFMIGEFRDENGERFGRGEPNTKLYWTRRALCILEGSSARTADPNFWVKQAFAKMSAGSLYVISDVRFKSELSELSKVGSLIPVRILRFDVNPSQDPSEVDLDDYPFTNVIDNRGAKIEQVFKQVDDLLEKLNIPKLV